MTVQSIAQSTPQPGVKFLFQNIDCLAVKAVYKISKAIALNIVAADTEHNKTMGIFVGSPVARASINIERRRLAPNQVVIKTYSENLGLLPVLLKANIVILTDKRINSLYGLLPLVTVNSEALAEF
jgi:hypothetical protein